MVKHGATDASLTSFKILLKFSHFFPFDFPARSQFHQFHRCHRCRSRRRRRPGAAAVERSTNGGETCATTAELRSQGVLDVAVGYGKNMKKPAFLDW